MELHLRICGIILMILAAVHVVFPRYFNWKEELSSLSLINRQMMQVHTFFIAFMVFLMGLLCFACSADLLGTSLGRTIMGGLGVFWAVRLVFQLFVYSPELWRGKMLETAIHILFIFLWAYLAWVFFSPYLT